MEKGREGIEPYAQFAHEVYAAENDAERELVDLIRSSVPEDWKAGAWLLERRHPRRWGRLERSELTGANGGPVQVAAQVVEIPAQLPTADAWAVMAKPRSNDGNPDSDG